MGERMGGLDAAFTHYIVLYCVPVFLSAKTF
jgi:hypothetical protein